MSDILTTVNVSYDSCAINIPAVEKKYDASYVGMFALKTKDGWTDWAAPIFWVANPKAPYTNHYFAMYVISSGKLMITDGTSSVDHVIVAVEDDNGEIIYSRYQHDCRYTTDGSAWIDGGCYYTRSNRPAFTMRVQDGKFVRCVPEDVS